MIDDTRGAVWSYSTEVVLEPMKNIGVDKDGIPKFIFYKTPTLQVTRVRKVLLEQSDIVGLKNTIESNSNVYSGNSVIKSFSSGSNFIVIGSTTYYPGSITYIDYPNQGNWEIPPEEIDESVLTSIVGYDVNIKPYSSGSHKGKRVSLKKTEIDINNINIPQGLLGNRIYTRYSPSNIRIINGIRYRDVNIEYKEW